MTLVTTACGDGMMLSFSGAAQHYGWSSMHLAILCVEYLQYL